MVAATPSNRVSRPGFVAPATRQEVSLRPRSPSTVRRRSFRFPLRGGLPPSEEALVGTYLPSLPNDGSPDPADALTPTVE